MKSLDTNSLTEDSVHLEDDEIYLMDQIYATKLVRRIKETQMIDRLQYSSYRAQRDLYKVPYKRCKKFYDHADIYEMRYQLEKINKPHVGGK